jgi:hypothetical protein
MVGSSVLCESSWGQVVPSIQTISEFHSNPLRDLRPLDERVNDFVANGGITNIDGPVIRQDYSSDVSRVVNEPEEVKSDSDLAKEEAISFTVEHAWDAAGGVFGEDLIGKSTSWAIGDVIAAWTGTFDWTNIVPVDSLAGAMFSEGSADLISWVISGPIGLTGGIIFDSSSTAGPEIDEIPSTPPVYAGSAGGVDTGETTIYQPPQPPPPPDPCENDPCCGDPCCGDPCCGDPCCGDPCCEDPLSELCPDDLRVRATATTARMQEIRLTVRAKANAERVAGAKRHFWDGRKGCVKILEEKKKICLAPKASKRMVDSNPVR